MPQRSRRSSLLRDRSHTVPLLRMSYTLLGTRALLNGKDLSPRRPDGEYASAFAHLNVFASQLKCSRQTIEDPIIGDIPIPGDLSFFGGEAFPGEVLGQRA